MEYRDPYSAFGRGLQGGMEMGLLGLKLKQQKADNEKAARQEEYEQDYKKFKTTTDFLESKVAKNLPGATKMSLYNERIIPFLNKHATEVPIQKIKSWDELTPDFVTKLKAIDEASNDRGFKIKALGDLMTEAETANEASAIKGKIEGLQSEQESGMLSQASRLSALESEDPRQFAAIQQASQQYPDVVSPVSQYRREALEGAGPKGQEILASGMKQEEKPEKDFPQTEKIMGKDGKLHVWQYNPATKTYDKDLGLAPKSERDTYADTQILSRIADKFNADPNIRRFGQMENFASIINDAAIGDNPIAHASIPTLMARAVGEVGALSEADKAPFGGSRALVSRLEQALTEMASGKRTAENIGFIQGLSNTLISAGQKQKAKIARVRAKQYSAAHRGKFSEEEIFNVLSPYGDYSEGDTASKPQTPSKPKTASDYLKNKGR